jgi:hypothetical protein
MRHGTGYALVEICVVILAIATALTLTAAGLNEQRLNKLQLRSTTQVRGIVQSLVTYGGGNREWYPGVTTEGEVIDVSPTGVFKALLDNNSFSGKYAISPMENLEPWQPDQVLTTDNLSYAILDVDVSAGLTDRFREWRQTINSKAAVVSDRNTGAENGYASVWTPHVEGEGWSGGVGRNDGSASHELSPILDKTKYGHGDVNERDHLFESEGESDALMTFFKDKQGKEKIVAARPVPQDAEEQGE